MIGSMLFSLFGIVSTLYFFGGIDDYNAINISKEIDVTG